MDKKINDALDAFGMNDLADTLSRVFAAIEIAEEEITAAQQRHPEVADKLWHSNCLLAPPAMPRMRYELIYRAHCREILDRVAAGADTRPGTAAEVLCVLTETSMIGPLTSPGYGLHMRMYLAAGLPDIADKERGEPSFVEVSAHHEALESSIIDDHEARARKKCADPERMLGDITCKGYHHGEPVDCVYAKGLCECFAAADEDSPTP